MVNANTDVLNAQVNASISLGWRNASTKACYLSASQVLASCSHCDTRVPVLLHWLPKKDKPLRFSMEKRLVLSSVVCYLEITDLKPNTQADHGSQSWNLPHSK